MKTILFGAGKARNSGHEVEGSASRKLIVLFYVVLKARSRYGRIRRELLWVMRFSSGVC